MFILPRKYQIGNARLPYDQLKSSYYFLVSFRVRALSLDIMIKENKICEVRHLDTRYQVIQLGVEIANKGFFVACGNVHAATFIEYIDINYLDVRRNLKPEKVKCHSLSML